MKHERQNAQTSRRGWRPRQTSDARLAMDIAYSIQTNADRSVSDYTTDERLATMVIAILSKEV